MLFIPIIETSDHRGQGVPNESAPSAPPPLPTTLLFLRYTVFSDQPPVGADPRHASTGLGPWGNSPLTLFSNTAKGKDEFGKGKGKHFGKDKGNEYGKAKGKHKTKDKRAFPYKAGRHEWREGYDFHMVKGKRKEGKDKGKGKNSNKEKDF